MSFVRAITGAMLVTPEGVRPGTIGIRDGRMREVLAGLKEGQTVVLHPGEALEDGARVEPLE